MQNTATILDAGNRRLTVRSARTGKVRVYRVYRDGHWELDHALTEVRNA